MQFISDTKHSLVALLYVDDDGLQFAAQPAAATLYTSTVSFVGSGKIISDLLPQILAKATPSNQEPFEGISSCSLVH